jgi:hypothetical protein
MGFGLSDLFGAFKRHGYRFIILLSMADFSNRASVWLLVHREERVSWDC